MPLKAALALFVSTAGMCHAQSVQERWVAAIEAADAAHERADFKSALEALKAALKIAPGDKGWREAVTLTRFGYVYTDAGKPREAEGAYLRALAAWQRADPNDPLRTSALMGLSTIYRELHQYSRAERYAREVVEIREKAIGVNRADMGAALENLAAIYHSEQRYSEALELYRRAITMLSNQAWLNGPATAHANLGVLLADMGRIEEGIAELRQAIRLWESAGAGEELRLASGLTKLGTMYCRLGRWQEAAAPLVRARDVIITLRGSNHPTLEPILKAYADVLRHTGRKQEARQTDKSIETLRSDLKDRSAAYTVDVNGYRP